MKQIKIAIGIFALLSLVSCEEVIELELDNSEPQLVIEALIIEGESKQTIQLTKTADFYSLETNPLVSDADIIVYDESNILVNYDENEPGTYVTADLIAQEGKTYFLDIVADGKNITASAKMPEKIWIDSLSSEYILGEPLHENGYLVNCHFQDPHTSSNFYKFKLFVNGEQREANNILSDDKIFNGNAASMPINRGAFAQIGDTVKVELWSINKETYDFFLTASQSGAMGHGPNQLADRSSLSNPTSNLVGEAYGYFGAVCKDSETIIIEE